MLLYHVQRTWGNGRVCFCFLTRLLSLSLCLCLSPSKGVFLPSEKVKREREKKICSFSFSPSSLKFITNMDRCAKEILFFLCLYSRLLQKMQADQIFKMIREKSNTSILELHVQLLLLFWFFWKKEIFHFHLTGSSKSNYFFILPSLLHKKGAEKKKDLQENCGTPA